ncbi:GPI transamidase component PIG-T protein [Dioscorea alata]|uniref:GPI transamidase component PIG-T protein n=1 Tax=Dioscorea alata TaxID=55571 RepID=A0ACB7UKK7_DIOAL|nr:GPI transamidase component PIG-T protein [Dioscorea alata]
MASTVAARAPATIHTSFLLLLVILLSCDLFDRIIASSGEAREEEFTEELLLKPLPDKKILAHFHFQSTVPPSDSIGHHHHLFPKAIAQLVKKFHIRELELSFTQGRWNYESWGGSDPMSNINAKPPGVEMWAVFDLPVNDIDESWKGLTHALSGIFCSSLNFLESSTAYSAPHWGLRTNSSSMRYGALPREAVCTENLTPWLKLLPCRDKAGLASLLDRPSIYKGYYHSQRLQLFSSAASGIILDQTLTVVLQPNVQRNGMPNSYDRFLQPNWSIMSMFKKKVTGQCALARASSIFIELEDGLATELEKLGAGESWNNLAFDLSVAPDRVIKEHNSVEGKSSSILYEFKVVKYSKYEPLDVGIKWKLPLLWSCPEAPFHARRFLMGSGNERGSIAISLQPTQSCDQFLSDSHKCTVRAVIFQVAPWYVKVYYHTLQIFIDGRSVPVADVVEKISVSPSEDKVSPGSLQMMLRFPCDMNSAALAMDFDKGFLHIDEYPPDANQGFDIPSAVVSFPDFYSSRSYLEDNCLKQSPLLLKLQRTALQSYTEVLLVPLTTPDFSMPYNVITFTCTVLALYFGSLLNALRRRIGEEEQLLKSKDSKRVGLIPRLLSKLKGRTLESHQSSSGSSASSKPRPKWLFKVIFVALIAVLWHYYSNID